MQPDGWRGQIKKGGGAAQVAVATALVVAFAVGLFAPKALAADDAGAEWLELRDREISIYFQPRHEAQARHIIGIYRQHMPILERRFKHRVHELHLVVLDMFDISNGYSTFLPRNVNGIFLLPPTQGELLDQSGWLDTVIRHEIAHLYHLDTAKDLPGRMQSVFGRAFPLFPALFNPPWLIEGIATYHETDQQRGIGRGASGYFDAIMRLELNQGLPGLNDATYSTNSGAPYYYGYYFFEFLHHKYNQEAIFSTLRDYSGNLIPYMLSSTFDYNLGRSLNRLWNEYRNYLRDKFGNQIASIKAAGLAEGKRISAPSPATPRSRYTAEGELVYIWTHPYTGKSELRLRRADATPDFLPGEPGLVDLEDAPENEAVNPYAQAERVLVSAEYFGDFDLHPLSGIIYSAMAACDQQDDWRKAYYYDLYLLEPGESEPRKILGCQRYHRVRWRPDGHRIFALRHQGGIGELNLLALDGTVLDTIHQGGNDEILGSYSISRDGERIAISRNLPGLGWDIHLLNLATRGFTRITDSRSIEIDPVFLDDDNAIVYAGNKGGVYNIWRYDPVEKNHQSLTNNLTAAFEPALAPDGMLVYTRLHQGGDYALHRLPLAGRSGVQLKRQLHVAQQPPSVEDYQPAQGSPAPYSIFRGMAPTGWYPQLKFSSDYFGLGAFAFGQDILGNQFWQAQVLATNWERHQPRNNYEFNLLYTLRNLLQLGATQKESVKYSPERDSNKAVLATNSRQFALVQYAPYQSLRRQLRGFAALTRDHNDYYPSGSYTDRRFPDATKRISGLGVDWYSLRQGRRAFVPNGIYLRAIREWIDSEHEIPSSGGRYSVFFNQYVHLRRGHGLSYALLRGEAEREQDSLSFGEQTDVGLFPNVGSSEFPMPGYRNGDALLHAQAYSYGELAWNIPGFDRGLGFMSPPIGMGRSHFRLAAHHLRLTRPRFADYRERGFSSVSAEARLDLVLGFLLHIPLKLVLAQGLEDNGEKQFTVATDLNF